MHRLMLLSSAYRMSSRPNEKALEQDPENKLLHHVPVRRLEGEAIRDALLAISGELDPKLFGPSVMPHISKYQEGRGKPESGPLDGDGRRSIYIQVRRNFLTPLFLAFDYPLPISTIGDRTVSTVPSQALMMMNNEFVAQQAKAWARRAIAEQSGREERIEAMYLTAFARPPGEAELARINRFLAGQSERYGSRNPDDPRVWGDLAHVLINTTEFIFLR